MRTNAVESLHLLSGEQAGAVDSVGSTWYVVRLQRTEQVPLLLNDLRHSNSGTGRAGLALARGNTALAARATTGTLAHTYRCFAIGRDAHPVKRLIQ